MNIKEKFGVEIEFPIIAGLDMKGASTCGMIHWGVATPETWQPVDKVIAPPPATAEEAKARMVSGEYRGFDFYFGKKSI